MNKTNTVTLTEEETILTRDALIDMKHNLKRTPSERGQRLCKLAAALAQVFDAQINQRRF
jgi:hypothetical protein